MVNIHNVDLEDLGITLASDRIGIVIGQLFVDVSAAEPYKCKPELVAAQLDAISATLDISKARHHQAANTHFTIFPEYGLPGQAAIEAIDAALSDPTWLPGSVVIGGVDGLTKAEFTSLSSGVSTHLCPQNDVTTITDGEWINCAVIWIKRPDGSVERWIQPKLSPAWPEQQFDDAAMFRGKSVWVFRGKLDDGTYFRFCTLICFDWIGPATGDKNWRNIFQKLENELNAKGAEEISISWFFVIQRNAKPSHSTFLTEVQHFYNQTVVRKVKRGRTCLIFANTGFRKTPGKSDTYGGTSLIFSKETLFREGTCQATFSRGGERYRGSDLLNAYYDNFFREAGACIHSFALVNPAVLQAGAAGSQLAIERAFAFPLYGVQDPRLPGNIVPGSVKWLNDELDDIETLASKYPQAPLCQVVEAKHPTIVTGLRVQSADTITRAIHLATAGPDNTKRTADDWGAPEQQALSHVVDTLNIFATAGNVTHQSDERGHAVALVGAAPVDIVAIHGRDHGECLAASARRIVSGMQRSILVVTRDRDNTPLDPRERSILRTNAPKSPSEAKITDPQSKMFQIGYADLLAMYRQSDTPVSLKAKLDAVAA
jgi:hypothetical protein